MSNFNCHCNSTSIITNGIIFPPTVLKEFKKSCKEASNKKCWKQTIVQIEKYFEFHFQKFQKHKYHPKTYNNQNSKYSKKSYKQASNEKSLENKLELELNNIENNIFKISKTQKLPQKNPKTYKSKIFQKGRRRQNLNKSY